MRRIGESGDIGEFFARFAAGAQDAITPEREAEIAREQAEREERERRVAEEEQRAYLVEHGCPVKDLDRVTGGELAETRALAVARAALDAGDTLLVISGVRGCGKSTAAAWWVTRPRPAARYLRTRPALFVDAAQVARWPRYEDDRMRDLERARALVVDDLGIEYDDTKGAFRSLVDALINARYAACLPTLITTNLPAAEFKARYGERVADRIREAGRFVEIGGESMRGRR